MPPDEPSTRPTIPDYELIRLVGRGSYGDVWLARGVTGIFRAIKIVWRARFDDAQPYEREFRGLKEFAAISLLESRQLALLHVGRHDIAGFFYYVMELADDVDTGRDIDPARYVPHTLKEVRTRRGRLPAPEVRALAVELARALAGLHTRGLVHRDVKPSNIILVGGAPKLADIGLVASASAALTFVGTEGYVPPEGPGAPAADVFALGKLLYELATGLDRHDYPRLPAELHTLPDRKELLELNEVLIRACEPRAAKRYRNAREMLTDLELIHADRSVRGRRNLRLGIMMAAGLVAVCAVWVALWWRPFSPRASWPLAAVDSGQASATPSSAPKDSAARIWQIYELGPDVSDHQIALAEDLGAQLVATAPTNAAAWAAYAMAAYIHRQEGDDESHYPAALSRAQRAIAIAGDSLEARLALGNVYCQRTTTREEGIAILQKLSLEFPADPRVWRALAIGLRKRQRFPEALAATNRAIALPGLDPWSWLIRADIFLYSGRLDEAEAAIDRSLSLRTGPGALLQKVQMQVLLRNNLDAAAETISLTPAPFLLREQIAWSYGLVFLLRRQPKECWERFKAFENDVIYWRPRSYYMGRAAEMSGDMQNARALWRAALQLVEGQAPTTVPTPLNWKAMLLACLGENGAALRVIAELPAMSAGGTGDALIPLALARLGRNDEALALIARRISELKGFGALFFRCIILHDPYLDTVRSDPRFHVIVEKMRADPQFPLPAKTPSTR